MSIGEELMNQQLMLVLEIAAIAVLVIIVLAVLVAARKRRTERLRGRFGPEYDRTVRDAGNVGQAESALQAREARVKRLHITPLAADQARRYSEEWQRVQARFVDEPAGAVLQADRLIGDVMAARGYPIGNFEERIEDISVDHANVVMNYRAARAIADEHARHPVSTEDMRQAMVHYRALFTELVDETATPIERGLEPPVGAVRERRDRP